ncbi:low specificity L-threonine aldolase [Psychromarinibacter sp. C21-152]|uniref:L-threonine aldolase n=1 Tax=Psychromarinibacter sediminicola TaxID=3033385 RepID=A0AAE3NS97_9RHOB|nr:low specificity L-threonine aldolase [Psychromarinibacter sediminicola]MDF0601506.1 low specificity L-threonine aldolase [Psychromarinibacter sediminicola]
MYFASDNTSPAHPKVLDALAKANEGYMPSYGADPIMDEVRDRIRDRFEAPEAAVYLVATGSTANALSLATFTDPWTAIFCHRISHVEEDECGAPEFYTGGAKLTLVDGAHGRMDPDALRHAIRFTGRGGVHNVQRGMVTLTNVTEAGTVYTVAQVEEIARTAREFGLPVHMDGARFANAIVATNATPAEMTWRAGVDVLSFGGTKNGLMGVEAVVIFDPDKAWEFELRRKRGGHLFSKHRYLSAQMLAYLEDDLWLQMARDANHAGQLLSDELMYLDGAALVHPADANMAFPSLPRALHRKAKAAGAQYNIWPGDQSLDGPDDEPVSARLVCSWCTTEDDVDAVLSTFKG